MNKANERYECKCAVRSEPRMAVTSVTHTTVTWCDQVALDTRSDIPDNPEVGFRSDWPDFIVDEVENKRLG